MKAILEFNLPEDKDQFTLANRGMDYWSALWDLQQEIRKHYKYDEKEETTWETVQNMFFEILGDRSIDLDEIS